MQPSEGFVQNQKSRIFFPKILTTWKKYSLRDFCNDLIAGLIVGVIAIPLSIAFGIASGVGPENGLITAIVAGFLISILGGSRVQIGGPTGAFVVIIFDVVQKHGVEGLSLATLMAGVILVLFGLMKIGTWIRFIPHPVVIGFTSGIAVSIFASQIPDLLGLPLANVPAQFVKKIVLFSSAIHKTNFFALAIAAITIGLIVYTPRFLRRVPGAFLALIAASLLAAAFSLPVETIGSRFGAVTLELQSLKMPVFSLEAFQMLMPAAISIALLGGLESLLSAVVADGMIGGKHRPNTELIAQGIANIASPFFGGIPATGAIARTAASIRNGGRTPIAGIVHSAAVLLIMIGAGSLITWIPMSALGGILAVVAYNMSEWREFKALLSGPKTDVIVLLATFFTTVFVDLILAVQLGLVMSFFLFAKKMSEVSEVKKFRGALSDERDPDTCYYEDELREISIPKEVEVYNLNGALFFGASSFFEDAVRQVLGIKKAIILRMKDVLLLDATGLKLILELIKEGKRLKTEIYLTEANKEVRRVLERSGGIAQEHLFPDLKSVLKMYE